ncbi:MAG: amino acid ABC transporter permease [Bacillota bacterium]
MGGYNFDWGVIIKYFPVLLGGLKMTLFISGLATVLGIIIGLMAGLARVAKNKYINLLSSIYVQVVRGIPLLVFLLYIYFGFGSFIDVSALLAAIVGLGVFSGAYVAEIVRGGIESIPKGQWEAAQSIGLSYRQQMRLIILPQALRAILPALAGQFIILIKDSSLVSVISIVELTLISKNLVVRTFQAFEVWTLTAAFYLVITYTLSKLIGLLENKYKSYSM